MTLWFRRKHLDINYCAYIFLNLYLGNRISLISKKNIRYQGVLYSINESDATVALKEVKSYGTEGRELLDTSGQTNFVPPQDTVHAFLLFRGQDIKDLHVHEQKQAPTAAASKEEAVPVVESEKEEAKNEPKEKSKIESKTNKHKKGGNQKNMVGSGASLLNKKARGAKGDQSEYLLDSLSWFI